MDKEFRKMRNGTIATVGLLWLVGAAATLAFWGGLIYFAFWCLKHFGVI